VIFAAFAAVALLLAGLGLFGLAGFTVERRTREIGIRKAMGAETGDVTRLLLWQFAKPVLWANLIAWPVAGYIMYRWLLGFAYRVDLEPWLFVAASLVALAIAMLTVSTHSVLVARAKPITALRHE
jgi:putative ABC transport system permease protein